MGKQQLVGGECIARWGINPMQCHQEKLEQVCITPAHNTGQQGVGWTSSMMQWYVTVQGSTCLPPAAQELQLWAGPRAVQGQQHWALQ